MFPAEFPTELAALTFRKRQVGTCVDASPRCLWASSLLWKAVIFPWVWRTSFSGMPGHEVEAQPKEGLVRGCRKRQRCITCLNFRCEEKWGRKKKENPPNHQVLSVIWGFKWWNHVLCPFSRQAARWAHSSLAGQRRPGLGRGYLAEITRQVFPDRLSSVPFRGQIPLEKFKVIQTEWKCLFPFLEKIWINI